MSGSVRAALVSLLLSSMAVLAVSVAQAAGHAPPEFELADTDASGTVDVEEYRARMIVVFSVLDENGDGHLVREEVPDDRVHVFAVVDVDDNGRVILREYLLYVMPKFWNYDLDDDGVLTPEEVEAANQREDAS